MFLRQNNKLNDEGCLIVALEAFDSPEADPVALFSDLVACVRPYRARDGDAARANVERLLAALEASPRRRQAVALQLHRLLGSREMVGFFADSGILPATGFFSEVGRILGGRLLPEVPDETEFRGCLHAIFDDRRDWIWLAELPDDLIDRVWRVMAVESGADEPDARLADQMLEAALVLAYRVSGMGIERDLERLGREVEFAAAPRFRAVARETQHFVDAYRAHLSDSAVPADDERHLLVIIDQCFDTLARARRAAVSFGTSLSLTYVMKRATQSLRRLEALAHLLGAGLRASTDPCSDELGARLIHNAVRAEAQRNSVTRLAAQTANLLALRVTDNAARTGEHYITATHDEYRGMLRSAMGAGVILAVLAMVKIFAAKLPLPLFGQALVYSLNYGLGFVLVYMLHLTIATKQPAMTAQTIAGYLGEAKVGRAETLERIVDLMAAVSRSQMAAIFGNVVIAFPLAILIGVALTLILGYSPIDTVKGEHLFKEISPLGWTLWYAAIAGVFLFLSGLLSGYFDNKAVYDHVGLRVSRLRWLRALAGDDRARRVGAYIEENLGGMMGNFLFGVMLGTAGIVGIILGLPIDIRHIAFSSANLGYALVAFDFSVDWHVFAWGALGVMLIGLVNLTVSFTLALWMALKARSIVFAQTRELLRRLWRRMRTAPGSFFRPPRVTPFDPPPSFRERP
ncbi:MAG: recombinase [Burkholderiaceae bacterium]